MGSFVDSLLLLSSVRLTVRIMDAGTRTLIEKVIAFDDLANERC